MPPAVRALPAALVLALLSGCGGGGGTATETTTAEPPTTSTTPPATTTAPAPRCSAAGEASPPAAQPGLPAAVAAMRERIVAAAVACDYERLARLAGPQFTYSFGGSGDFASSLRRREEAGEEPLRYLVGLLERPYASRDAGGATQYVWPSAYAYGRWSEVPRDDREALRPLYGDRDFARFRRFGSYAGYRIGIDESGRWQFFVAGD